MQFNLTLQESVASKDASLFSTRATPPRGQLLKWIGNKQRFARGIILFFPQRYRRYFEPFLGSGAVLAALSPACAEGSDVFSPLMGIWTTLKARPADLKRWYSERYLLVKQLGKKLAYEHIRQEYNLAPNPADLLFLSRSCYGGVVRFRMNDGFMSTPCGVHDPISPASFASRVDDWHSRVTRTNFYTRSFEEALDRAGEGDVVYCDPPYSHSQAILYGAQRFNLDDMFRSIELAKRRGAFVAVSIDGSKKSGNRLCDIVYPKNLFRREESVVVGRSMLRRFQMGGETLEKEVVRDRLLLTH